MERLTFGPIRQRVAHYFQTALPCEAVDRDGRTIGYRVEIFQRTLAWKFPESGDTFPPSHITNGPLCYEVRPTWTRDGQEHGRTLKATYAQTLELATQIVEQLQERANKNAVSRYAESTAYHIGRSNYSLAIDQAYAHDSLESAIESYADNACQTMQAAGFPGEACLAASDIVTIAHRNASNANHK
jgi:hypothetical protein